MYFKALPRMIYPWKDKTGKFHGAVVPDIFRRVHLDKFFKNRQLLEDEWVEDGDMPEHVAYKYYGSMEYHWIVLLSNNIVDVRSEWPLSHRSLVDYVEDKYGSGNASAVHHYVDTTNNYIVDWDAAKLNAGTIKAVTNYDYETEINDNKRQITLLNKQFLKDIVTQYKKLVK